MSLLHWVWLGLAVQPGSPLLDAVLKEFPDPEEFFLSGESGIAKVGGISQADALRIRKTKLSAAQAAFETAKNFGADVLCRTSPQYPQKLLEIKNAPAVLYAKGDLDCLNRMPAIATVGTRNIINHVQARDNECIDNMQQALDRAVANGVKHLVVQPTHLMHGAEYDEMTEAVNSYADKFESVAIAEPLLGEVGSDAAVINADKKAVAEAVVASAVESSDYDSLQAAADDGTAFVLMGHGTSHTAKVSYSQMQAQMNELGYSNVFIGTVEGEPEETSCEAVIKALQAAGYTKVILRPLMVVAGDHANNDMAGDDEDSWKSMMEAADFESVACQIEGLGRIEAVQDLYIAHG